MSNIKYIDGFYNEDYKNAFLEQYSSNQKTYEVYARIFKVSKDIEEEKEKELGNFNSGDLDDLFTHLNPLSTWVSASNISVVRTYINWFIENGYRENNLNPIDMLRHIEGYTRQFVDDSVQLYYSKKTIEEIVDYSMNKQDAVIPLALFEGIAGKESCEIRNLKYYEIDFERNVVLLTDLDGSKRELVVSDKLIELLKAAYFEQEYFKKNGSNFSEVIKNKKESLELLETGYILKPAKTRLIHTDAVKKHVISRRLATLGELFGIKNMTAIKIVRSGMIYLGYKLYKRDGVLGKEQLVEVCQHFNLQKIHSAGRYDYAYNRVGEYVNLDTIKELYGE
ncbi:hypothetical protein ACEU2D_18010 [Brevibacillus laterosporus]|uniref:phage lytic cycle repressor MrpR family protein n=1 Tax=Brevibacillus laterosporus TaxID=1465 RepID=UPI0035A7460F